MQEASAKGKSAQFKDRSDAVAPDRSENLAERKCSGNGESPQAAALVNGKGTKASADGRMRKGSESARTHGQAADANPAGAQKPDAGASAGDKSLARPVARQGEREARHRAPSMARKVRDAEGSPEASQTERSSTRR